MNEVMATVVAVLSSIALLLGLIGLTVRFVLLPYVREHVVTPVQETRRQVSVNGGNNQPPTLLDKVGQLDTSVQQLRSDFIAHLVNASRDTAAMWNAIEAIAKAKPPDEL